MTNLKFGPSMKAGRKAQTNNHPGAAKAKAVIRANVLDAIGAERARVLMLSPATGPACAPVRGQPIREEVDRKIRHDGAVRQNCAQCRKRSLRAL